MRAPYKARIYRREDGRFEWQVRHRNGRIVATSGSQGYSRRADAYQSLVNLLAGEITIEGEA